MKLKFTRVEKVAGFFVLGAVGVGLLTLVGLAVKQGWFESRRVYWTHLASGQGLTSGSDIQFSGVRIGSVGSLEFVEEGKIRVEMLILDRYRDQLREGAVVKSWRPFLIGSRILEITSGQGSMLKIGSEIPSRPSNDVFEMIANGGLSQSMATLVAVTESMTRLLEAFAEPKRTTALIETIDDLHPLVRNFSALSTELTKVIRPLNKDRKLEIAAQNIVDLTVELRHALPALTGVLKDSPRLTTEITTTLSQLTLLTGEMTKILPAISVLGPDISRTTRRAVEALDETVVVLKAMQKSFLLRGAVKEVRAEEAAAGAQRAPASDTTLSPQPSTPPAR